MRAHKLTLQALWQILLPVFLVFVKVSVKDCYDDIASLTAIDDLENIPLLISSLKAERFQKLLKDFVETKSTNVNFVFWWSYMDMVSIYCSSLGLNGMVSGTFISTRSVKCYHTSRGTNS